jgi:hypothetical protein
VEADFSGPGAYCISASRSIPRVKGSDPNGIIHVGESGYLRNRIITFHSCAGSLEVVGHMAGWRFAYFRLNKIFPIKSLRVRWIETKTKERAYKAEARVLVDYIKLHFELPPLNYKFNWALWDQLEKEWKQLRKAVGRKRRK